MESKRQLTREELLEMESAPKTKIQHMLDVVICFCPYFAAIIMLRRMADEWLADCQWIFTHQKVF